MSTFPKPFLSPEEYLKLERAAHYRSEYFNGEMFAMSGASLNHSRLKDTLALLLGVQLDGRPCFPVTSDLRVRPKAGGPYFYPDLVIVCGEPNLEDKERDTVTDATVIIEVLSPSTERYDRTFKFDYYRLLPSITDYLLIAQDRVEVERKTRDGDAWNTILTTDPEAIVELRSIGCNFRVRDMYRNVQFPPLTH
jgi:Uma2 family endonuclease